MNCRKAGELIPLHAGGDLAEREATDLLRHIDRCARCAAALEEMRRTLSAVREIAATDAPPPLPADFEREVRRGIERGARMPAGTARGARPPRFALVAAGIAAVAVIVVFAGRRGGERPEQVAPAAGTGSAAEARIGWSELQGDFGGCAEGPYRLAEWDLPSAAGVIAVMHKPDPLNHPDLYVVDYCGESDRLSRMRSYPWFEQRIRRFAARAGSDDNLYIAVCRLDASSRDERRRLERTIIEKYAPYFNGRRGV